MKAGIWKHYKGGLYLVIGVAAHSETGEDMVVYVALTGAHLPGPRMRVRPRSMWEEEVDVIGGDNEGTQPRFVYVGETIPEELRPAVSTDNPTS